MKCAVTGHTSGIGKAFYDHFTDLGWEVTGYSRSNGYALPENIDILVEKVSGVDVFINSSYVYGYQEELTKRLARKVKKMIVCNTISKDYPIYDIVNDQYVAAKKQLYDTCNLLSVSTDETVADIVTLKLAFMEGHTGDINNPKEITSDHVILFNDVIRAVDFWLENPVVTEIGFKWKLTQRLYGGMIRATLPDTHIAKEFKNKVDNV